MKPPVVAFLGFAFAASPALAQNVVINGEFPSVVSSWSEFFGEATIEWNALDWASNPASGSAGVTNTSPIGSARGFMQCIPFELGVPFDLGAARVRFPSGQSSTGTALVSVLHVPEHDLHVPDRRRGRQHGQRAHITPDVWFDLFAAGLNPQPGTRSVALLLLVLKDQPGGQLSALFDRVVFGPAGTTSVALQSFAVE